MQNPFILAIDQGTTGTKTLLVNTQGQVVAQSYVKHTQYYPQSGWVEHDPEEIWNSVVEGTHEVMNLAGIGSEEIAGIGLANQGETVMWWDAESHHPLYPAVVWSCRRSQEIAERWENDGDWSQRIVRKTGLRIDPYFSATKIRWMMDHVPEVKQAIAEGRGKAGTLDSWLIWKMTGGRSFVTDVSTAARTLLFNIYSGDYDPEILSYLGIERRWLPEIRNSIEPINERCLGVTAPHAFLGIKAPILVSLVDQPAALYGHLCIDAGTSKVTYGTGCFAYMNAGVRPPVSSHQLLSTVVWGKGSEMTYALDGGVYSAGSSVEWGMNQAELYPDIDTLQAWSLERVQSNHPNIDSKVYYVPALSGLGAPYWDSHTRATFLGISHNTTKKDLGLAILEGIAYRVADVLEAMEQDTGHSLDFLRVDGGLTQNPYLMQFQADLLGVPVEVPDVEEVTAMGVAYLLGIANGWWTEADLIERMKIKRRYEPRTNVEERKVARDKWKRAVDLVRKLPT